MLATNVKALKTQRDSIAGEVEEKLNGFLLTRRQLQAGCRCPGADIKSREPNVLLTVGDRTDFPDAAHLDAYTSMFEIKIQLVVTKD